MMPNEKTPHNPIADRARAMEADYLGQLERIEQSAGAPTPKELSVRRRLIEAGQRARRLIWTGDEPACAEARAGHEDPVSHQSARTLHQTELMLSEIRHSTVETCFYNLQLYAGMASRPEPPADIGRKLQRAFGGLAAAEEKVEAFLDREADKDVRVETMFPPEASRIRAGLHELGDLRNRLKAFESASLQSEELTRLGRATQSEIDAISGQLAEMQGRIDGRKICLAGFIREVVESHKPGFSEAGVELEFSEGDAGDAELLANESGLSDAVGEAIRNALKHGFGDSPGCGSTSPKVSVGLSWADSCQRTVQIEISDNGAGLPRSGLKKLVTRGFSTAGGSGEGLAMIRRVVEEDHLGQLDVSRAKPFGTRLVMRLPLKVDPENFRRKG